MTDSERVAQLDVLAKAFKDYCGGLGAENIVIGVLLPVSDGWQSRALISGTSDGLINCIAAQIQMLRPEDFNRLCEFLVSSPAFEMQRNPPSPSKPEMVN